MYDKSKKSWSQRLKTLGSGDSGDKNASLAAVSGMQAMQQLQLHMQHQHQQLQQQHQHMQQQQQQQQQQHLQHHGHHQMMAAYQLPPVPAAEFLPSALSRSMKYAEPWIYGTVRGIPSRPSYGYHPHAAAIFAATEGVPGTTALAVVICSCAEYLNGTKRDVKKASVCKKCKGSRLPLATIGGTSGGTVRLPSVSGSSHSRRPMAATMRVVSTSKKSRPSILDPQKDPYDLMRRTRLLSPEPSTKDSDGKSRSRSETGGNQPRGRTRTRAPPPPAPAVNQKSQGVGVPIPTAVPDPTDLWLMEDNESLLQSSGLASSRATSRRSILRCHVNPYDLISSESGKLQGNLRKPHDLFDVADAQLNDDQLERKRSTAKFYSGNVAAIAGQRISLGDKSGDNSDPGDSYERIIIVSGGDTPTNGPRRPPRNKKADEPAEMPTAAVPSVPAALPMATVKTKVDGQVEKEQMEENNGSNYTVLTVTPTSPAIKSILKRPTTLELPGVGTTPAPQPLPPPVADSSGLVTPAGKSQFYIPTPTGTAATPTPPGAPMATSTPTPTSGATIAIAITPGSRKKVQFMVEDKIIATTATAATTDDSDASVAATKTNYEYYNRKRNAAATAQATAATSPAPTAATATTAATSTDQQEATPFATDIDDEHNFTTSAEPTPFIKPDSLHYEDVLPGPQIFDSSSELQLPTDGSPHVTAGPVSVLPTGEYSEIPNPESRPAIKQLTFNYELPVRTFAGSALFQPSFIS